MHDHIRDSLKRFEYSEQLQETAVFRVLFEGEDLGQVATDWASTVPIPSPIGLSPFSAKSKRD